MIPSILEQLTGCRPAPTPVIARTVVHLHDVEPKRAPSQKAAQPATISAAEFAHELWIRDLTKTAFAQIVGVTRQRISRVIRHNRQVPAHYVTALAKIPVVRTPGPEKARATAWEVKAEIARRGITQKEAARQMGYSEKHLSYMLNGHDAISLRATEWTEARP